MKSLIVFLSPAKSFAGIYAALTKVQIENSLDLGYSKDDVILVTNFPWEYAGVKAIIAPDEYYCAVRPRSIKTEIVPYLIDQEIIKHGEIYWNHDLDAFELNKINETDLALDDYDTGLTDYGWRDRWCMGSFFVKDTSRDIYQKAREIIYKNIEDETAMVELTTTDPQIAKRCKRLNITYNFGMRNISLNWEKADKPLRVIHFKPDHKTMPTINMFMYGDNEIKEPLMDKRLKKILNYHRIK